MEKPSPGQRFSSLLVSFRLHSRTCLIIHWWDETSAINSWICFRETSWLPTSLWSSSHWQPGWMTDCLWTVYRSAFFPELRAELSCQGATKTFDKYRRLSITLDTILRDQRRTTVWTEGSPGFHSTEALNLEPMVLGHAPLPQNNMK